MSTSHDTEQVDLVVIGLGPGGEALASGAASAGLRVVAVDKHLVGGECPYYGCIPTKMMVRAADDLSEIGRAPQLLGAAADLVPSWTPTATRIADEATDHWDDKVAVERLEKAGVTVVHGTARLAGAGRVAVTPTGGGEPTSYAADRGVVLNPGTRPLVPPIDGLDGTPYWTNRDTVQVDRLPGSVVVMGGGPIGCEFAHVFASFGVRVTIVQGADRLLDHDEPEASAVLERVFVEKGIRVLTGVHVTSVAYADGAFTLGLDSDERVTADKLVVAIGRTPNLDDVGLETVGLDPAARTLEVDERMRAGDRLWAIGDVVGEGAFTHVSMYQSAIALSNILAGTTDDEGEPARYHAVPHVTFTDPEVAGVGMTEQEARDAGLTVRVGVTKLEESSRGFTHGPGASGVIKVVEDADRGVLVGATAVGPAGGEILGLLALAVHAEVPVATLRTMITAFPTFHRAIPTALEDLS